MKKLDKIKIISNYWNNWIKYVFWHQENKNLDKKLYEFLFIFCIWRSLLESIEWRFEDNVKDGMKSSLLAFPKLPWSKYLKYQILNQILEKLGYPYIEFNCLKGIILWISNNLKIKKQDKLYQKTQSVTNEKHCNEISKQCKAIFSKQNGFPISWRWR